MFKPTHYMKKTRGILEGFYLVPVIIKRKIKATGDFFVTDNTGKDYIANNSMLIDANKLENFTND